MKKRITSQEIHATAQMFRVSQDDYADLITGVRVMERAALPLINKND